MNSNLFGLLYYQSYLKRDDFFHYEWKFKIQTVELNDSISSGKEIVHVHTNTPMPLYVDFLECL